MRKTTLLAAALGLAGLAAAQTPATNEFKIFDGSVDYTSRGNLASNEGEALQRVSGAHFGYLRTAIGMNATLQDQNDATKEGYYLVFRKDDGAGKPDITATGVLYEEGPFGYSGTGTGAVGAWGITWTFKTPVVLPDGPFFYGFRFAAVVTPPGWPTDGGSTHMSGGYPTTQVCGEHPRLGVVPDQAWNVNYTGGAPSAVAVCSLMRAWNFGLLLESTALQAYAVDPAAKCAGKLGKPDLGYAALWPDLTDLEAYGYFAKLGWRLREGNEPGGLGFVFLSPVALATPIKCAGVAPGTALWWLHPLGLLFSGIPVVLDANGQALTPEIDLDMTVRRFLLGTAMYAQAVVISTAPAAPKAYFSNWCAQTY